MINQALKLAGATVFGVASVGISFSAPTLTNLSADDLAAFSNGAQVEVTAYRPGRALAGGLGAAGLGLLGWWLWRELAGDRTTTSTTPTPPAPLATDAAATITQSFDAVRQRIFDSLNTPDYAWILQLLECETLLVVGGQGFGKTRFVASLCYLRHLLMGHQLVLVSPHGHQDDFWAVPPIGSHGAYNRIGMAIADYQQRIKRKNPQSKHLTQLWDEFTQYGGQVDNAELLFRSVATEPRKANEHHILVAHSEAKGIANGGGKASGFQDLKDACIVLTIHGKRGITGKAEPAFKGHLKGFSYDDKGNPETVVVTYPQWLHYPEKLLAILPISNSSEPSSEGLPEVADRKSQEEAKKTLEDPREDAGRQTEQLLGEFLEEARESLPSLEEIAPRPPYPPDRNLLFLEFAFLFVECDSLRKIFNDVWGEGFGDGSRSVKLREWCKLAFSEWLPEKHRSKIKRKHPSLFA